MTNIWSNAYREQILNLLPPDGTLVKAGKIYKKSNLSTVTVSKYLTALTAEGVIERVQVSQKNVSYRRLERVRLQHLIENFADEMEKSVSSIPKDTVEKVDVIAKKLSEYIATISRKPETEEGLEEIKNDYYLINETLFYTLISQMFRIIKTLNPIEIAKIEDFYVDSMGNLVPKKLVDQRIKPNEISEWTKHNGFTEEAAKIIRENLNEISNKRKKKSV